PAECHDATAPNLIGHPAGDECGDQPNRGGDEYCQLDADLVVAKAAVFHGACCDTLDVAAGDHVARCAVPGNQQDPKQHEDRKSTRLNSSHVSISYAVFCLKKKTLRV